MATNPNQRMVITHRTMPQRESGKPYLAVYCENIARASRTLSGEVAFKLYLYLLSNQDNYKFSFSPQAFSNEYGVSADRTRKVWEQLMEAGYIKRSTNSAATFEFYELPQKRKLTFQEEVRLITYDNNITEALTYSDFETMGKAENYSEETIKKNWLLYPLVNGDEVTNE